jgi:hypothetical protein
MKTLTQPWTAAMEVTVFSANRLATNPDIVADHIISSF